MAQHVYHRGYIRVQPLKAPQPPFTHATFLVGDVVFMGDRRAPHHSMVVVQKSGPQVLARGFNNAGAFGGPYMAWDSALRNLADMARWDAQGCFRANNGPCELYTITYDAICRNIPDGCSEHPTRADPAALRPPPPGGNSG